MKREVCKLEKRCPSCGVTKLVSFFYKNVARGDGLASVCKICHGKACRESASARWAMAKLRTGVGKEEYDKMFLAQGGVCAICGSPPVGVGHKHGEPKPLQIDHCHGTGTIRGLLCLHCNTGLGYFRDNTKTLAEAIKYLSESRAR